MAATILFTGFPGFIGARLIPRLLADDPELRVVALVEPRMVARARTEAAAISDRIVVEPGDITAPRLGLTEARWRGLADEVTRVLHLAAIYDLGVGAALAEAVNVRGTENVVAFCRACRSLERLEYVSTAYVAGGRSGRVLESDLAAGQAFKNHYEATKFAAEVIVRAAMDDVPTAIYRPAIVVGDSRTGETAKFDGPYYVLRFLSLLDRLRLPLPQFGSEEATFNVVPVDFVVEALAAGARTDGFTGETLHLVDPEPVAAAELVRILAGELTGRTPRYPFPTSLMESSLRFAAVRTLLAGTPRESIVYLNHPVTFDTSRATELLGATGLRCPRFREYAPTMVAFFRAHEDDEALVPARGAL